MHAPTTRFPRDGSRSPRGRDLTVVLGTMAVFTIAFLLLSPVRRPAEEPEAAMGTVPGHGSMNDLAKVNELPTDFGGLVSAGNSYMDGGSYAVAAEAYRRALDITPESPDVRTDYGACLHAMGLPERAAEEFRKTLAVDSHHAVALFNLGVVFHDLGQADSAQVYWQRCLDADPNGASAPTVRRLLDSLKG